MSTVLPDILDKLNTGQISIRQAAELMGWQAAKVGGAIYNQYLGYRLDTLDLALWAVPGYELEPEPTFWRES